MLQNLPSPIPLPTGSLTDLSTWLKWLNDVIEKFPACADTAKSLVTELLKSLQAEAVSSPGVAGFVTLQLVASAALMCYGLYTLHQVRTNLQGELKEVDNKAKMLTQKAHKLLKEVTRKYQTLRTPSSPVPNSDALVDLHTELYLASAKLQNEVAEIIETVKYLTIQVRAKKKCGQIVMGAGAVITVSSVATAGWASVAGAPLLAILGGASAVIGLSSVAVGFLISSECDTLLLEADRILAYIYKHIINQINDNATRFRQQWGFPTPSTVSQASFEAYFLAKQQFNSQCERLQQQQKKP